MIARRAAEEARLKKRVTEALRLFTDESSLIKWNSPEEFKRSLQTCWWHLLEDVYRNFERPTDTSDCKRSCHSDGHIVTLNKEVSLHGCLLHGGLHCCADRLEVNEETGLPFLAPPVCEVIVRTASCDNVCMFSGRVSSRAISSTKHSHNTNQYFAGRERETFVSGPQAQVGVGFDYYKSKVTKESKETRLKYMHCLCEDVIVRMLYKKKHRQTINTHRQGLIFDRCNEKLALYHAKRKRKKLLPLYVDTLSAFFTPMASLVLLPELERDEQEIRKFATLTMGLWNFCNASPYARDESSSRCKLAAFALAILYLHREGFSVSTGASGNDGKSFFGQSAQLVPYRKFIAVELPSQPDIHLFSDSGQTSMQQEISSWATKIGGEGNVQSSIRAPKKRKLSAHSGSISGNHNLATGNKTFAPHHRCGALGDTRSMTSKDERDGCAFFMACINSMSGDDLKKVAQSLFGSR